VTAVSDQAQTKKLVRIAAGELDADTAQTSGMQRAAAVSGKTVGAEGLWMGTTTVPAHTDSGAHHHGHSETGIYVAVGTPIFAFRDGDEVIELQTQPGDFVFVPPYVPHRETNPSDEPAVVVIARTTQEAIAVPLDDI
jgi:uncharacterized RmlC-like cupin family protein